MSKYQCTTCHYHWEAPDRVQFLRHPAGHPLCPRDTCCHCFVVLPDYTEQELKEIELANSVQDVYSDYRQSIGDHKMDAHRWERQKERHVAFAVWLKTLAARVERESGK